MLLCTSLENEFRKVSVHLWGVRNILQLTEEWEMRQIFFRFQANIQRRIIAKSYFCIIADKTQLQTIDS